MSLRSGFAAVLATLLLVVGSSAALCQMSCVLPQNSHLCCDTHGKAGAPSLAHPQACTHAVRPIAASPVIPVAAAQPAIKSLPPAPVVVAAASVLQSTVETASPPKFNLRI